MWDMELKLYKCGERCTNDYTVFANKHYCSYTVSVDSHLKKKLNK